MVKTQKIIEAEANLQVAKMMDAITRIKNATQGFSQIYDGDFNDVKIVVTKFFELTESLRSFSKTTCNGQDLKMVTDIVDGIKLRSKYEQEIKDRDAKLAIAAETLKRVSDANRRLLDTIANICITKSEKKLANDLIKGAKQYRQQDVIDRLFVETAKPLKCDDEQPF